MKLEEPTIMLPCTGDPECEKVCLIPLSSLKEALRKTNTTTMRGLAESFVYPDCRVKFEGIFRNFSVQLTLNDASEPN